MSKVVSKITSLTAAAALLGVSLAAAAPAQAAEDSYRVDATQARAIARRFLRAQGLTAPLRSAKTARIGTAELDGDTWYVTIYYGGSIPHIKGVVLVDSNSGAVNES